MIRICTPLYHLTAFRMSIITQRYTIHGSPLLSPQAVLSIGRHHVADPIKCQTPSVSIYCL